MKAASSKLQADLLILIFEFWLLIVLDFMGKN